MSPTPAASLRQLHHGACVVPPGLAASQNRGNVLSHTRRLSIATCARSWLRRLLRYCGGPRTRLQLRERRKALKRHHRRLQRAAQQARNWDARPCVRRQSAGLPGSPCPPLLDFTFALPGPPVLPGLRPCCKPGSLPGSAFAPELPPPRQEAEETAMHSVPGAVPGASEASGKTCSLCKARRGPKRSSL